MDSNQGRLFIGGISWYTNEDKLKEYFGSYGEVAKTVVLRHKDTGNPRGCGFVIFADPGILDKVLQDKHVIDGCTIEAKRAMSRDEQASKSGNSGGARNFRVSGGGSTTKKIFVGGLPQTLSKDRFRQYFEAYGAIKDSVMIYDKWTRRPRGFGFISFDSEDAVNVVLQKTFHNIDGKQVEVKRDLPKNRNNNGGGRGFLDSTKLDEAQTVQRRYLQSADSSGWYPPYGSSRFNPSGYEYGTVNASMHYGIENYGSDASPGGYGNPNAPGSGYGGIGQGAGRGDWSSQGASPYRYGVSPAGIIGQSGNMASGYGNQDYGGIDRAHGNQASYGGLGGLGSHGSGPQTGRYMGGCNNSGWQS